MTDAPPPREIIPAATLVIFRHAAGGGPPELLMVQRSQQMRFAGGASVFPGGRIDPADHDLAKQIAPDADREDTAARIAAIRETLEETGLMVGLDLSIPAAQAIEARALLLTCGALGPVLDQFGWKLKLDHLTYFARWCPNHTRSFDTWFYLADIGTGAVTTRVDATENTRLFWISAADALTMADAGEISVIFPTRRNLERLALFNSHAEAVAQAQAIPARMIAPSTLERDGELFLTISEGLGYPITEQSMKSVRRG